MKDLYLLSYEIRRFEYTVNPHDGKQTSKAETFDFGTVAVSASFRKLLAACDAVLRDQRATIIDVIVGTPVHKVSHPHGVIARYISGDAYDDSVYEIRVNVDKIKRI